MNVHVKNIRSSHFMLHNVNTVHVLPPCPLLLSVLFRVLLIVVIMESNGIVIVYNRHKSSVDKIPTQTHVVNPGDAFSYFLLTPSSNVNTIITTVCKPGFISQWMNNICLQDTQLIIYAQMSFIISAQTDQNDKLCLSINLVTLFRI